MQLTQIPHLWRVAKIDMLIWVVAFVSTVVLNVREGLFVSVGFALLTTVFRQQRPPSELLGDNKTS
jgi:MFS superfamily sulfate permease-like transporter